jgi:ribosomal subunit interface protein
MTVIVESKQMKVTASLRQHVELQAQKLLKLSKRVTAARVYLETVRKKSNDKMANLVTYCVELPGKDVVVRKRAVDMYQAIADATEGAVRQVRKQYEKRRDSKRQVHHLDVMRSSD